MLALWPATAPLLDTIADPDQLTFAHYAHRTLRNPIVPALIHIGDAWHCTSPQLGQGANMALLDAYALALALREAANVAAALARTVALRQAHIRLYQAMSRVFTPIYQRMGARSRLSVTASSARSRGSAQSTHFKPRWSAVPWARR